MKLVAETNERSRLEWLAVGIMTLIGGILRFWPIGGLGLTHFDEGVYALVASRILPFQDLIPYAPPGYPILGGWMAMIFGRSDSSMLRVSQIAGTLTIPVVGWIGRRTFGPGAGFVSAVFCALSGSHIAFSRMALTDSSALLVWLLAIGAGMRFLEQPGFVRAFVMGLAVGLAQEFKYNGWMTGGIVILAALVGIAIRPEERKLGSIAKTFGWGLLAGVVAWLVVWPWFAFVEAHGGYSALLRHQRNYLGGFRDWWPNLLSQADQAVALSGGAWLILPAVALVALTPWMGQRPLWDEAKKRFQSRPFLMLLAYAGLGFYASIAWVDAPYLFGFLAFPWLLWRPAGRLVLLWWFVLVVTSPFYHPYARLWLPLHASHWLLMAWIVADAIPSLRPGLEAQLASRQTPKVLIIGLATSWLVGCVINNFVNVAARTSRGAAAQPDLLAPSDSLRQATSMLSILLPDDVNGLQILVRPAVTYYLTDRATLYQMANSEALLKPGQPDVWAVVDSAMLRSELGLPPSGLDSIFLDRFAKHWEVVKVFPNQLSLPTALDLDPNAARSSTADRNCTLWLLRPRRPGTSP